MDQMNATCPLAGIPNCVAGPSRGARSRQLSAPDGSFQRELEHHLPKIGKSPVEFVNCVYTAPLLSEEPPSRCTPREWAETGRNPDPVVTLDPLPDSANRQSQAQSRNRRRPR